MNRPLWKQYMIHVYACINQNPCGSTKEYIARIPYLNYVSGGVVHLLLWGILRNIPFTILGTVIVVLFTKQVKEKDDTPFRHLALTIILSFGCYLPVVLFAETVPMVGMLMIPKTCVNVWTVWIGFQAMKNCQKRWFFFLEKTHLVEGFLLNDKNDVFFG